MREAEEDTVRIIKHKIKSKNFNGVIHCFTGTQKFADEMIELGFYISASGIITFKKSDELRSVFKSISNNRLLIETDSPYLSPEPLRGKSNQPSHIIYTIKRLAEIRNTDYDHIVSITNENFFKLFTKINKK
jgi:TatD DNase family protein